MGEECVTYNEFETVDALLGSGIYTRRIDAFILVWAKMEKQLRRLFLYLVFQSPSFSHDDRKDLINTLCAETHLYPANFIKGFDRCYPKSLRDLVGQAEYDSLWGDWETAKLARNKFFHGQYSGFPGMASSAVEKDIKSIRAWMNAVASACELEFSFGGLEKRQFVKNDDRAFYKKLKYYPTSIGEFAQLLKRIK